MLRAAYDAEDRGSRPVVSEANHRVLFSIILINFNKEMCFLHKTNNVFFFIEIANCNAICINDLCGCFYDGL